MLEKVKLALRLKTDAFDAEVSGLIAACKADLRLVGIKVPDGSTDTGDGSPATTTGDPLIDRAIILYAKANYGYLEDSEKYQRAYDYLKCSLSLAGDYNAME